jgi:hypothetical protein
MENSAGKYKSDTNRSRPFLAVAQIVKSFVSRLIGFFKLTEDDRLKAGIGRQGHE